MARPALSEREIESFRDRLCEVATRRFAESGTKGVSMRGLADELGCSATTPYRYFRDKGEILAAVRARAFARLAERGERVLRRPAEPLAHLERMGRAYLRFAREEPHAYRIAFELDQPDAGRYPELVRERKRAWRTIRAAVDVAVRSGALDGDVDVVSHLFWAGMHGLVTLELAGQLHAVPRSKLELPMIRALLRGTSKPSQPRTRDGETDA